MASAPGQSGDLEHRVTAPEQAGKDKRKDGWDKAKVLSGFFSSVVIAGLGLWINSSLQSQAARGQMAQTAATIQSEREKSDTDIRARMFEVLMKQFFHGELNARQKVMLLELLEKNFQDILSAAPLFAMVEEADTKRDLIELAKAVAQRQEVRLGGGRQPATTLHIRTPKNLTVGDHNLSIELTSIAKAGDHITIALKPGPNEKLIPEISFGVSYFDLPMVDHTLLPDDHRLAVTLKNANYEEGVAVVKILEFDRGFVTARERPQLGRLKQLIDGACTSNADCKSPRTCVSGQCEEPENDAEHQP